MIWTGLAESRVVFCCDADLNNCGSVASALVNNFVVSLFAELGREAVSARYRYCENRVLESCLATHACGYCGVFGSAG